MQASKQPVSPSQARGDVAVTSQWPEPATATTTRSTAAAQHREPARASGRIGRAWARATCRWRRRHSLATGASPATTKRRGGQRARRRRLRRVRQVPARDFWRGGRGSGGRRVRRSERDGAGRRGDASAAPATAASRGERERGGGFCGWFCRKVHVFC